MPIIDFKATMCKHCYKCVRGCEVKSIMIRDGHAYIMPNRCILCGQCLLNCPQSAKRVPSELSKVKKLIESGAPVIASLSSSYMGVLPYKKRGQVKSALKKLGFTNVCDAAEGAALATEEYVRLLEQGEMKNIITTACPSIVNLIEIHYPELIKYLNDVKYSFNSYTMNRTSILLGTASIEDDVYFKETVEKIVNTREWFKAEMKKLGFTFPDSKANFLFASHPKVPAKEIFEAAREKDIYVRYFDKPRINNYLRITIGTDEEMEKFLKFLTSFLKIQK